MDTRLLFIVLALASVPGAWADDVIVIGGSGPQEGPPSFDGPGLSDDYRDITKFPSYERYHRETGDYSFGGYVFNLAEEAERGAELTAAEYAFLAVYYTPTLAAHVDEEHPGAVTIRVDGAAPFLPPGTRFWEEEWCDGDCQLALWYHDSDKAKMYLDKALRMAPDDYRVAYAASAYYYGVGAIHSHEEGTTNWLYRELKNEWKKRFVELAAQIDPEDESVREIQEEIVRYEEEVRPFGAEALASARTAPDLLEADREPYAGVTERAVRSLVPAPDNPDAYLFYGSLAVLAFLMVWSGTLGVVRK